MQTEFSRNNLMAVRADKILSAAAATTAAAVGSGLVGDSNNAEAAIVYSGAVNINVPATTAGIYVNVVTGQSGTASGTPGWDINPWSSTGFSLFSAAAPTGGTYVTNGGFVQALGTVIDGTKAFGGGVVTPATITLNGDNYFGFRFRNEPAANATNYGWFKVTFGSTIASRAITGYAYEDTGAAIAVGQTAVPEPTSLALLATGAAGLFAARRRRKKAVA